jgi:RNA polymerase sigma-70 factor (ECF subfamily)
MAAVPRDPVPSTPAGERWLPAFFRGQTVTRPSNPIAPRLEGLLAESAQGNQAAFERLYHATKGKLFATALLIVKRGELAEEVVQETYVRIWTRAASYDPALGSPIAWMAAIARNMAINLVRRPTVEVQTEVDMLLDVPAGGRSALDEIELSQEQRNAMAALRALDPVRRRLIVAAYLHGESREQLAKRFGVPAGTIKTWIRRSLIDTRAHLETMDQPQRTVA